MTLEILLDYFFIQLIHRPTNLNFGLVCGIWKHLIIILITSNNIYINFQQGFCIYIVGFLTSCQRQDTPSTLYGTTHTFYNLSVQLYSHHSTDKHQQSKSSGLMYIAVVILPSMTISGSICLPLHVLNNTDIVDILYFEHGDIVDDDPCVARYQCIPLPRSGSHRLRSRVKQRSTIFAVKSRFLSSQQMHLRMMSTYTFLVS